ncbi:hypothetical protein JCM21900_000825 [Sporobolomyces salmonicolor]
MDQVQPQITSRTLVLDLNHPAVPTPLYAQLNSLRDSLMLFVGAPPTPFAMSKDSSVAMVRPNGPPASTSLSKTSSASLSLSARLSRRYQRQVFLSLDLSSLADSAGGSNGAPDVFMVPMERALIQELDTLFKKSV